MFFRLFFVSTIVSFTASRDETGSIDNPGMSNSVFGALSDDESIVTVRLLDLRGQSRIQQQGKSVELERNVKSAFSRLPSGYYVLRINDQENNVLLNRFIYKF